MLQPESPRDSGVLATPSLTRQLQSGGLSSVHMQFVSLSVSEQLFGRSLPVISVNPAGNGSVCVQ